MKLFFLLTGLFFLNLNNAIGQELVLEFDCDQKSRQIKKYTYSLSNELDGSLAILIREKKKIFAYLFDETFKPKSEFVFQSEKKNRFNTLLGYTIKDSKYSLIYSDNFKNIFFVLTADFQNKTSEIKEVELDFKEEKYLKTISHKNSLYVLSSTKKNQIIIRILNDDYEFEVVKTLNLELDKEQKLQSNYSLLLNFNLLSNKQSSNITKIDNRVPNAIERTSQDNKIYIDTSNLYLTFDNKTDSTLMYIINLEDFSLERKEFLYPIGKLDEYKKYNSFYVDHLLFQLASSNNEMTFVIRDLNGKILNIFYFDKETPINIKNSSIIQEKETFLPSDGKREFEETSKFLRKISSGKIGLSVLKKETGYHLIVGGVKEYVVNSSGFSTMPTTTIGMNSAGNMVATTTFNPTYSGFSSYNRTKSIYFNTKLDFNFNYKKEEISSTIFEKIENYKEALKYISAEDIFFHKNELFFGYFNMKEGLYKLIRF